MHAKIIRELESRRSLKEDSQLWHIHFRGNKIRLSNGKSEWKRIGHAKSALRNDLCHLDRHPRKEEFNQALKDLQESGDIAFVQVL